MKDKKEFARHFREVQPKFARLCMRSLSRSGMTMPQYALLNLLAAGPLSMKEISQRMHITKPAVTNLVDRLEEHGFLCREPDLKDRRITMIIPKPKGKKLVESMQSTVLGFLLHAFGQFSPSERGVIKRFYAMLSQNFDQNLMKKKTGKLAACGLAVLMFFSPGPASALGAKGEDEAVRAYVLSVSEPRRAPLDFEEFIRIALSRSETVKASREEIMIARARTFQALGEAIGDGDFVVTHTFQEEQGGAGGSGTVGGTFNSAHRRERRFAFTQPLFQGFKSVGALLGSGSLKGQRQEEYEFSKETLFIEAAEAFYTLLSAEQNLEILNKSLKLFEERITDLGEREKIGRSRPGEVSMARAKMKILEARLARARGNLLSAQSLVGFYTGVAHERVIDEDPETFSETLDIDIAHYPQLVGRRADVQAAENAMNVAKQAIVVKQSAMWPQIRLDANQYVKREGFQDGISWDALVRMNVPLYRGGDNIGQILEATSNYKKARFNYEQTRKLAMLEIEQAHQNWIASREENRAYQEAVKAGEENFNYQREDYGHNLVSNLDVLEALEELLNIREEANSIYYQMKIYYWHLQIAVSSSVPEWADPANKKK